MNTTNYKRRYRELDDVTKHRISLSMSNRQKSETHKEAISQSMKDYWSKVKHEPKSTTTIEDIMW